MTLNLTNSETSWLHYFQHLHYLSLSNQLQKIVFVLLFCYSIINDVNSQTFVNFFAATITNFLPTFLSMNRADVQYQIFHETPKKSRKVTVGKSQREFWSIYQVTLPNCTDTFFTGKKQYLRRRVLCIFAYTQISTILSILWQVNKNFLAPQMHQKVWGHP